MTPALEPISLNVESCRTRQQRLRKILEAEQVERAILVCPEHVQYLTGFLPHRLVSAIVCLDADGHCLLVAANSEPDDIAADTVVTFEAQWHCTLRQEQPEASAEALQQALASRPQAGRVGVEFSRFGPHYHRLLSDDVAGNLIDLEGELRRLRRAKDEDELAMIRRAVACTEAMYARAREVIEPGITEIEVFSQLHAAAVEVAGEPLTALGNDYQSNASGGPPRPRAAQSGELMILDLGPAYRGYYADNCRTFAIDGRPTDEQQRAWERIVAVLDMVEATVRPGISCRDLFMQAQVMLDDYRQDAFCHHLGHGFGLFPHEAPHLNPHWDDTFEAGDTFTAEPGLYTPDLKAGIRLEQNYVVTPAGVDRLTSFPLEL